MAIAEIPTLREVADNLKPAERAPSYQTQGGTLTSFKGGNSWCFRLRGIDPWRENQKAEELRRDGGPR